MAPMKREHGNETSGSTPLAYADKYQNLALSETTTACSCSASTPHRSRPGRVHRPDPPGFPATLEQISLDRENKALVITGTGDSFMD
jgi:hypothetical protein